jgi:ABC-type branched-subunit amino acid transport system ATPase component
MLPFIIGASVVTYGAYVYFNKDKSKIKEPTILIGPQGAGKTHLVNWLSKHNILDEYNPTMCDISNGNFLDIPGYEKKTESWENLIKDFKNIFYLFDMEKFLTNTPYTNASGYKQMVINHITFFTEHLDPKKETGSIMQGKQLFIIGTHLDKISNERTIEIIETFQNEKIQLGDTKIVYGSLLNEEQAKKLEEDIEKLI